MSGGFPEALFPVLLGGRRDVLASAPSFVPTSLSGCVIWLRGDLGVTLAGSNVATWANQAGANHSAEQTTDALRPQVSTINGKSALIFNGTTQTLVDATAGTSFLAADAKYTLFLVWEHTAGTGTQVPWRMSDNVVSAQEAYAYTGTALNQGGHLLRASNALGTSLTGKHIITCLSDTGFVGLYDKSALHASVVATPTHNAFNRFFIGSYATSNHFGGKIGEVALFSRALTSGERAQMVSYMSSFWAI